MTDNTKGILKDLAFPIVVALVASLATGGITHAVSVGAMRAQLDNAREDISAEKRARETAVLKLEAAIAKNKQSQEDAAKDAARGNADLQRWMGQVDAKLDSIQSEIRRRR